MGKTIAVVVSYNRRQLLSECIAALRNQTRRLDAILVVNNGSTDGTANWLSQQPDIITINQENVGSAGGFHTGLAWAYKRGYSWIWCMDDDGYPKEDALENLLASEPNHLSLLNCAVIDKADKKSFVWKTRHYKTIDEVEVNLIKGIGHPFNGTLVHRNIIERVGLPKTQLFLWGDESEYYCRITKKNKIPVYTVSSSVHYHPAAGFNYKRDWDYNSAWKMYYYVRNRFAVLSSKCNTRLEAWFRFFFFLVAVAGIVMVFQKSDKIKKLSFILWPAMDAVTSNFAQTPQTIIHRLNAAANSPYKFKPFKSIRAAFQGFNSMLTLDESPSVING